MAETGADLIAIERRRQIETEGRTPEHDASHTRHDLALAAACYAMPQSVRYIQRFREKFWPWSLEDWKPTPNDRVRELVKAGALIAAEIDRLNTAPTTHPDPSGASNA